ncbi:hypothetical protein [Pseudonocardia alni]|uniref:hypothetical protein n=1 Tax=Pseudonocardia alni TaxID=33907 RepID=UPI0027A5942F|nr:hypothetical protein PaSha_13915 [Pseudonocardia alni]WFG47453.1 hypothetical protein PaSha_28645 [Pseudonocardia alni]
MRCSAGCGGPAELVVSRPGDPVVVLLCREHARALDALGYRARRIVARVIGRRGA